MFPPELKVSGNDNENWKSTCRNQQPPSQSVKDQLYGKMYPSIGLAGTTDVTLSRGSSCPLYCSPYRIPVTVTQESLSSSDTLP